MKRFRKDSNSPFKGPRYFMSWRLWALFVAVIWIFLPPPRSGFAACAPWEGGPCIQIPPPNVGGERPERERPERDSEGGGGGGGCATLHSHEDSPGNNYSAPPAAGTPHAQYPNVVWDGNGKFHPAEGYTWVAPNDPDDFRVQLLPAGTLHPRYPNVVWDGTGKIEPEEGYQWAYPNDLTDFRVEHLPDGVPHRRYPNVVWAGGGLIRPASGFVWATSPPGPDFRVVRYISVDKWSGSWGGSDTGIVMDSLRGLSDVSLMNWLAAHADFGRYGNDGTSPLSAIGATLKFKDRFFTTKTSIAQRENLVAFEGGKVFYDRMKDVPLPGGGTLGSWFRGYYGGHFSAISDMKASRHGNEVFTTTDLADEYSAFGHVFRAQALQLEKPKGYWEKKEWEAVQQEVKLRIDQVLQGR